MSLTALIGDNAKIIDELFEKYKEDQNSVSPEWISFFKSLDNGGFPGGPENTVHIDLPGDGADYNGAIANMGILNLMNTYRTHGHMAANLDPLQITKPRRFVIDEKLEAFSQADLNKEYETGVEGLGRVKLSDIINFFEKAYCGTIGVEHRHLMDDEERRWVQDKYEAAAVNTSLDTDTKLRIFDKIIHADYFERFLAKKYVGKKRFSLEGGESLITLLDSIIEKAGNFKMNSLVIGMAHRGRLNVLVNTIEKPAGQIFAEFEENYNPDTPDFADVKYHLGYSNQVMTSSKHEVHLSLMFNPSHLEAVNPVCVGSVRARQTMHHDKEREKFMGILIHGDAAFIGQGVVAETFNLMNLEGFDTGGTVHIVINNQIGFTTLPEESRSTLYATDLAKGFQIPILHVNGDDPEAVHRVVNIAMDYRQKFKKDVIIDLICYRRLGHNEMDEPAFTQPTMYDIIRRHPRVPEVYEKKLLKDADIEKKDLDFIKSVANNELEASFKQTQEKNTRMQVDTMKGEWSEFSMDLDSEPAATKLLTKQLSTINDALCSLPDMFNCHPKLKRLLENRQKMLKGEMGIDWGFAEALALGSILLNGHNIRLCGQDAERGTFSHRHAVMVNVETGEKFTPLNHIGEDQGHLEVINSPLSEYAVLGYEYGYSLSDPHSLIIWEAQFGDFANGAQIIFDQFLTCSEVKWYRMSGLVVLLPHGYEGQGPEHSSARLERFLQLCAKQNIQVCNCTTSAQFFHLLRRQILRKTRKPLVVMTPKSLLRLPEASSKVDDLHRSVFKEVIPETEDIDNDKVTRLLLCSGKVYYDIKKRRDELKKDQVAITRVEQLYPYPEEVLNGVFREYKKLKEVIWVQEEPLNMGAYLFVEGRLRNQLGNKATVSWIARTVSASPAAGLASFHRKEQEKILEECFAKI